MKLTDQHFLTITHQAIFIMCLILFIIPCSKQKSIWWTNLLLAISFLLFGIETYLTFTYENKLDRLVLILATATLGKRTFFWFVQRHNNKKKERAMQKTVRREKLHNAIHTQRPHIP